MRTAKIFIFLLIFLASASLVFAVAPTQGIPILNSSSLLNGTKENLTAYNQSTADADNESVKNIYNWFRNNAPIAVLNMPFEGGSNSTFAKDYSGFDNNATVTVATWNSTGGYDGRGAYEFNQAGNLLVAQDNSFNITSEITVTGWVYALNLTTPAFPVLLEKGHPNQWNFIMDYGGGGTRGNDMRVIIGIGGSRRDCFGFGGLQTNQWHHVAFTYNGSTVEIYRDGSMISDSSCAWKGNIGTDTDFLLIGASSIGTPFNGTIDDVTVWNKSLSIEQIQALNNSRTDLIVSQETLLGETWRVDITPNDGTSDGLTNSSNDLEIINLVPTHTTPILNSTNLTNTPAENLTAYNQSTVDLNGDSIKNIYNWYKNSTSIAVLNMPFEGGSNASFTRDYSGREVVATAFNSPTWNATGGYDGKGAYEFDDSSNQHINISKSDLNLKDNPFTFSAWVKLNKVDNVQRRFFADRNGVDEGIVIGKGTSGLLSFVVENSTGYQISPASASGINLSDLQWHHIALRRKDPSFTTYVDGVLDTNITPGDMGEINSSLNYVIGRFPAGGQSWDGQIDEFLIYNYSLSAEQIWALFNNRTDLIVSQETLLGETWRVDITPNDGTADGTTLSSNTVTIIDSERSLNTSQDHIDADISDVIIDSATDVLIANFSVNYSTITTVLIRGGGELNKTLGGTASANMRVVHNGVDLFNQNLRTLSSPNDRGVFTIPLRQFDAQLNNNFSVYLNDGGGAGTLGLKDFSLHFLSNVSAHGNNIKINLTNTNISFSTTSLTNVANATLSKSTNFNSSTLVNINHRFQKISGAATSSPYCFANNSITGESTLIYQRHLTTNGEVGSSGTNYISTQETSGTETWRLWCASTDTDQISNNITVSLINLVDDNKNISNRIQFTQATNSTVQSISGSDNLVLSGSQTIRNGSSIEMEYTLIVQSTSGAQTGDNSPKFKINVTELDESACSQTNQRSLQSNNDIGTVKVYLSCTAPLPGQPFTSNVFIDVVAGETVNVLNASLSFYEMITSLPKVERNIAPIVTSVNLTTPTGRNESNETLTVTFTITDPDGDSTTAEVKWFKESIEQATLINLTTIGSSNLTAGDNWSAQVRPHDGIVFGLPVNSSSMLILQPIIRVNLTTSQNEGVEAIETFASYVMTLVLVIALAAILMMVGVMVKVGKFKLKEVLKWMVFAGAAIVVLVIVLAIGADVVTQI